MRTLQISDNLDINSSEGRRVLIISNELARRGYNVTIASTFHSHEVKERLESLLEPEIDIIWHYPLFRFNNFSYSPRLYNILIKENYDLIHAHSYRYYGTFIGSLIRKKRGIPYVMSPYGSISYDSTNNLKPLYWLQDILTSKYPIRYSDRILANTAYEKEQILKHGVDPCKIDVIYRDVDTSLFRKIEDNPFNDSKSILFVGRITPIKGLELILDALPLVNDEIMLSIIGPTEDVKYMRNLKKRILKNEIESRVSFLGKMPLENIPEYYSSALVLVLTSYYENLGGVLLEAQSCKCPVIATDVGGIREVLDDGKSGFILKDRSPEELAERINLLNNDTHLRLRMGSWGRTFIETGFTIKEYMKKILVSYQKAIVTAMGT